VSLPDFYKYAIPSGLLPLHNDRAFLNTSVHLLR